MSCPYFCPGTSVNSCQAHPHGLIISSGKQMDLCLSDFYRFCPYYLRAEGEMPWLNQRDRSVKGKKQVGKGVLRP